jgi:alpha-tubulin suppressor-like RCC1 family protein
MAIKNDGTVWGWGDNTYGQLGDSTYSYRTIPVQARHLSGISAVAGGNGHSLALKNDSTVWACGLNFNGQLGQGTPGGWINTPVQVIVLGNITAIAAGTFHSLALRDDGTVWSWGGNAYGQLGDGTTTERDTPVQVSTLTGIIAIAAGTYHSLAVKNDGTVWAWGHNIYGQIGNGNYVDQHVPVHVTGSCNVISGMEEITDAGDQFLLFPNPSGGKFGLMYAGNPIYDIKIYDLLGNKILDKKIVPTDRKDIAFDLSEQPAGIYIMQLQSDEHYYFRKIILE